MRYKINWDAVGVGASLACAIHCALLPLFLTSLPMMGVNIIHNIPFEAGMILAAFIIGIYSLYHGYRKHHHVRVPLVFFAIGFIFLVSKQFFVAYETWFLIPAVILIVLAHFLNYRLCRLHNQAHSEDCVH